MTIETAALALRRGECTPRELTEACLARIRERQPAMNAFITVTEDMALAAADTAKNRLA